MNRLASSSGYEDRTFYVPVAPDSEICVRSVKPSASTHNLTVVHLSGYRDDMTNPKSGAILDASLASKAGFVTLDYRGHGQSKGPKRNEGLLTYLDDADTAIKHATSPSERLVLSGHSIGAHNALYLADRLEEKHPGRIAAIVAVAPVFAFMDEGRLSHRILSKENAKKELAETGQMTNVYAPQLVYSRQFIEDYRNSSLVREENRRQIKCPLIVVHSASDAFSPTEDIKLVMSRVPHARLVVSEHPTEKHTMTEPGQLTLIKAAITEAVTAAIQQPEPSAAAARAKVTVLGATFALAEAKPVI